MLALYDKLGTRTALFLEDEERFVSAWGSPAAFLQFGSVYNYGGGHVGWWNGDCLRGHDGGIILWAQGAAISGLSLPAPFMQSTIPRIQPNPGKCFTVLPPDRKPDAASFSTTIFGVWN